jgi:hypothetical protein
MAAAICEHPEVVIQASRQVAGKTWTVGLVGACEIIAAGTITIGYPSMAQATRLLSERVIGNLNGFNDAMSEHFGRPFFKRPKDQVTYQRWALADDPAHEGKYYALSANEIARSKPEGYTTDHLYLDESHRLTQKTLGIFEPFLDIAEKEGRARMVYMGVGGHRQSLIEQKKMQEGVHVVYWPASKILEVAPEWEPVFEKRRRSMSDWQYRQNYECLPVAEGMRTMFPDGIPEPVDVQDYLRRNIKPMMYFGIDVGQVIDSTVVKALSVIRGHEGLVINETDTLVLPGCDYVNQAKMIFEWIDKRFYWKPENIIVELTGVGRSFYDILNSGPLHGIRGLDTTAELKEEFWHSMSTAIREGRYGCREAESRAHYEAMIYEYKKSAGGFKMEFEHSDHWMALCMGWMGALSAIEAM